MGKHLYRICLLAVPKMKKKIYAASIIISVLVFTSCTGLPAPRMNDHTAKAEIIAHRGASLRAPENTYASAVRAWELNADAVEVDIRITGDSRVIALHDFSTLRTTGKHIPVSSAHYTDIESLDAGSYMSEVYSGEQIPLLTDLLKTVPDGKRIFLEWKDYSADPSLLTDLLLKTGFQDRCAVISFNLDALTKIKKELPETPCYLLKLACPEEKLAAEILMLKRYSLNGLDLYHPSITEHTIKSLHEEGLSCIAWTVNSLHTARKLTAWGIDGITTNKPGWFAKHLY